MSHSDQSYFRRIAGRLPRGSEPVSRNKNGIYVGSDEEPFEGRVFGDARGGLWGIRARRCPHCGERIED